MDEDEGTPPSSSAMAPARSILVALVGAGACRLEKLARVKQGIVAAAAHKHSSGTVFGWLIGLGLIAEQEKAVYIGGTKKSRQLLKEGTVTSDGLVCSCCGELFNLSGFEWHCGSRLRRPASNTFVGDDGQLSIADCQNVAFLMESMESMPLPLGKRADRALALDLQASGGSPAFLLAAQVQFSSSSAMEEMGMGIEAMEIESLEADEAAVGSIEAMVPMPVRCETNSDPFGSFDYSKLELPPPGAKAELFNKEGLPVARRRTFDSYLAHGDESESGIASASGGDDDQTTAHDLCCGICNEGGELLCCETCPATFHMECVALVDVPQEAWFCWRCLCSRCYEPLRTEICSQCERCYHPGCCSDPVLAGASFFCSSACRILSQDLAEMVGRVNPLGRSELSWSLLRGGRCDQALLAEAHKVLSSRFDPVLDCWTQIDYLDCMIYRRRHSSPRLDFGGFFTAVLRDRDREIVCAAVVRIHGRRLAEMPFIATKMGLDGRGLCRSLFTAVEETLARLGVETVVLLAAAGTEKMWKKSFGFQAMDRKLMSRRAELGLVALNGARFLQKSLGWEAAAAAAAAVAEEEAEEERPRKRRRGRPPKKDLGLSHSPMTPPASRSARVLSF